MVTAAVQYVGAAVTRLEADISCKKDSGKRFRRKTVYDRYWLTAGSIAMTAS